MTFDLKTAIKYLIMFLIGMGILYLAFRGQDLFKIWQEIKTAKLYYVAISSFSAWLAYVLRALRWQMLYRSIHYEVGFSTAYHAVMIGYLANLALPRFGEIVRCSAIHKTTKVPIFASLGTVITERLFDVLVLLLGGLALFIFQYDLVSNFLQNIIYHHIEEKLKQINYRWLLILGSFLISIIGILIYILRRKVGKKFLRIFVSLRQGFGSYSKMKRKRKFLLYTIGIWSLYLLSMYLCFSALAVTKNMPIDAAFTALIFSGFAMAAPVQGGIGVFHWMVGQSLVLYSISFKDGLAYATIIHSSQVLIILVLGSISLFRMIASHKKELGTHH